MFWFHSDSSKRRLGVVGDATIHERAVPILRQLPWLALQHIHVQQQRVSSTEQSRCIHVLLKLISVAATHIHDERQEVPGFSCFEQRYPFTVAADQVVEHTSNARNFVIAELLLRNWVPSAQHSLDAGQGLRQNLSLRFAPRVEEVKVHKQPEGAQDPILENAQMECVEHVDAELVNACSDFGAEQWVTAMHHRDAQETSKTSR